MNSVADILEACRRRGVELRADGGLLRFRPAGRVDPELRNALAAHKPALIRRLSSRYLVPAELAPAWREWFEERAAIREYDGGQALEHAEAESLREVLEAMARAGESPRA